MKKKKLLKKKVKKKEGDRLASYIVQCVFFKILIISHLPSKIIRQNKKSICMHSKNAETKSKVQGRSEEFSTHFPIIAESGLPNLKQRKFKFSCFSWCMHRLRLFGTEKEEEKKAVVAV